jgi:hypothetical protein
LDRVNEKISRFTKEIQKQKTPDISCGPSDLNPVMLKKLNMKVNYDLFEVKTAQKADKAYVDKIVGISLETQKSQKMILLMLNEILKVIQVKPDDAIHTKQKKISQLLIHIGNMINS